MKAITVEALSKTFSGGTVAVDGIRFSLNQGEIFGFLGPNGLRYKLKKLSSTSLR